MQIPFKHMKPYPDKKNSLIETVSGLNPLRMQFHNQKGSFPFGCEIAFLMDVSQRKYGNVYKLSLILT